jgi:endonuclease-3
VLAAPRRSLEVAIKPGGLARNKSRTIRNILTILDKRSSGLPPDTPDPLAYLADVPAEEALETLTNLPGVGLKTAACVLMFCCNQPVMPVDTHVHRLSGRLGLVRPKATADQTHHVLMAITPSELVYPLHVWLIAHGRAACRAQNPRCKGCVLSDVCPSVVVDGG